MAAAAATPDEGMVSLISRLVEQQHFSRID